MALIAWFPLIGNLKNYGTNQNITLTNFGATLDVNGKIGSCYSFTTSQYMTLNNLPYSSLANCSISFWIYLNSNESWLPFTGQNTSYYILATSNNSGAFYHSQIGSSWSIYADGVSSSVPKNAGTWHHYCITGVNLSTWTTFLLNKYGENDQYGWNFTGKVNDFRIYDSKIGTKEIYEISKGLFVHYSLNDMNIESTTNISSQGNCGGWNNSGTCIRTNDDTSISNIPTNGKTVSIEQTSAGQCAITFGTTTINVPSKTITASAWFYISSNAGSEIWPYLRSSQTDSLLGYLTYNGNGNQSTWPREQWIRISQTYTTVSTETTVYFCAYTQTNGCKFVFNGWQIEEKDHATPYVNGTRNETVVYDSSGYERNGVKLQMEASSNSNGRYKNCVKSSSSSTQGLFRGVVNMPAMNNLSISWWANYSIWGLQTSGLISTSSDISGPYDYLATPFNHRDNGFDITNNSGTSVRLSASFTFDNKWHFYTLTYDNATAKFYIDGSLFSSVSIVGPLKPFNYLYPFWSYAGSANRVCQGMCSDIRMFATTLSVDDIKSMYQKAATIDNLSNMYTYEYIETEDTLIDVKKTGVTNASNIVEPDSISNVRFKKTGEIESDNFYEI